LAAKPAGGQTRSTCWDGDLANEGYLSFNMKTNGWHGETGDFQLRELIFNSTLKSSFPRNSKEIEHTWAQKQYHVDLHLESLCHQKNTAPIRGHCWGWLEMISPLSLLGSFTGFTISPENLVKTMLSGEDFPWIQLDESHLLVSYFAVIHQFWGLFSCKPT
jgi:hypothetical protein